ncbi:MAG: ABC transporter permease [Lachnospiraceae bacterium]|nr:ABC transporter permease [Lachnospiraceae bacterium]
MLFELIKKGVKLKYRRSYLGILWTLIEPLLTTIVLTVIFGMLLGRGGESYPVYVMSGRLLYSFFSNATTGAMRSLRQNSGMMKKVYVPKYMYPLASVIFNYVIFLISMLVLLGLMLFEGVFPTLKIFACILPLIILLVMASGIGLILATMSVFFRDVEYLWSVALMMIMYASAIFYYTDSIIGKDSSKAIIFNLNPLYACIKVFRDGIFGGTIQWGLVAYSGIFAVVCFLIGLFMFYKKQDEFILHI